MILTHLVLFSFLGGASVADAPAAAETFSGGWGRPPRRWPAEETDDARKDRIKADRIRLGIIEPDPVELTALEAAGATIAGGAATLVFPETPAFDAGALDPALAFDLAQLHTGAYLDEEIRRHFELLDDEDAAVLLIAIATLH